ncbi:MAG: hypothetical protein H7X95_07820 [Deltaproteobacteria bacterium]|nr:hypothetical protein [Deltaproteobacteria bacterium]
MSGALTATMLGRAAIAPGVVDLTFSMRSPSRLEFRAGQFVSIAVEPDRTFAGTSAPIARRSYSIASPSDKGEMLRFIIRVIPDGAASDYLMSLPLGAAVRMTGPHGFFVLDAAHPGDIVFGATGTGVSAVMPMLRELSMSSPPPLNQARLYWGVRYEHDLFALQEIEDLCREARCALQVFLSSPSPNWKGGRGRITPALLSDYPHLKSPTFYLVGNGSMISELKRELVARGVNRKKQIRTEAFFD